MEKIRFFRQRNIVSVSYAFQSVHLLTPARSMKLKDKNCFVPKDWCGRLTCRTGVSRHDLRTWGKTRQVATQHIWKMFLPFKPRHTQPKFTTRPNPFGSEWHCNWHHKDFAGIGIAEWFLFGAAQYRRLSQISKSLGNLSVLTCKPTENISTTCSRDLVWHPVLLDQILWAGSFLNCGEQQYGISSVAILSQRSPDSCNISSLILFSVWWRVWRISNFFCT